jgi:AraC-like DNA-binding protein
MEIITNLLIFSGGVLALILMLGKLAQRNKRRIDYTIALLYLLIGFDLILFHLYFSNEPFRASFGMLLFAPFTFCIAPLLYFYFRQILEPQYTVTLKVLLHFMPGAVALLLLMIMYISKHTSLSVLSNGYNLDTMVYYIDILSSAWLVIYVYASLRLTCSLWSEKSLRDIAIFRYTLILNIEVLMLSVSFLIGDITLWDSLNKLNCILAVQVLLTIFILGQRYPAFLWAFALEASRIRYLKTRLRGINVDAVVVRLKELMELEQPYRDPELSLSSLSAMIDITPHQLSQILNERLKTNFKNFVNQYRLDYAQELLVSYPDRTILSVAFDAGFNSKSSFNTLFSKETGLTPSQYREKKV